MAAAASIETGDQLGLLRAQIEGLATAPDWQLGDDQLLRHIDELGRLTHRLTGLRLRAGRSAPAQDL